MQDPPGALAGATGRPDPAPVVIAVVVTFDRAALLRTCLSRLCSQRRAPDTILVIDDAGPGAETAAAVAAFPGAWHLRHLDNHGGAAAYCTGIEAALAAGADLVWLMDDDGCPADERCLERLIAVAQAGAGIAAPLVLDVAEPARLAFPIRLAGRTRFTLEQLGAASRVEGFAHLFNGALIAAPVFAAIGLPEPRFRCRGDEVEFLARARRAGVTVRLDTAARFLHPGSRPEIHPVLFGAFYAVVPTTKDKRQCQFRNRGHIFRAYGMWAYLLADIVRYASLYLLCPRPDPRGFGQWLAATATGWRGTFLREPLPERRYITVVGPAEARSAELSEQWERQPARDAAA